MMIDIFTHILPLKYKEELKKKAPPKFYGSEWADAIPTLTDVDSRFQIMDKYEGLRQVLTLVSPPVENVVGPEDAVELAKIANDEMAELVGRYPDKFISAAACLPMNDIDAALKELDRAVAELKLGGVQMFTDINGRPLDYPEFMPLYEKMAHYDLPIWLHPRREITVPDYVAEDSSKYRVWLVFGWPYETTVAMTRLVFSGVFEKHPNLKVITHHCGGMVPYFEQRIAGAYDSYGLVYGQKYQHLAKKPLEYYRLFYNDTAVGGSTSALMCAYAFCGASHLLFGSDMPFGTELGDRYTKQAIHSIQQMDIPDLEKRKIFEDNARRLLHLPV